MVWFEGPDDGDGDVQVNTADGAVRGGWLKSSSGAQLASYQGIPFAAPPLGNLRFRFHQSSRLNLKLPFNYLAFDGQVWPAPPSYSLGG